MCGRYALTTSAEILAQLFHAALNFELHYRYNIAPTQLSPVARACAGTSSSARREVLEMRWGLVPSWARDLSISSRLINARSETAASKLAFRSAFKHRRCLVPASGFYEWKKLDGAAGDRSKKQPLYIYRADGAPLVMAGLWESWNDSESGRSVESFTILTTDANDQLRDIHDRMPVILEPEQFDAWLEPESGDTAKLPSLLRPAAAGVLAMHPVSARVNSPRNDDASLLEPLTQSHETMDARDEPKGLFE